jgi:3-oxoacyl-[acyl-carrier protein] reductase
MPKPLIRGNDRQNTKENNMNFGITDKVALVAASSRGLGYATAIRLSKEGAKVMICSRSEENISRAAKDISAETGNAVKAYVTDVRKEDDVRTMADQIVDEFGSIHILVCNAGAPPSGFLDDFELDDYQAALELNLLSTINLSYAVVDLMKKQKWGRIINITSVSAKQPLNNLILSNTARAGVLGFSKSLSQQLAPFGITVNSVCPGYTKTERVEELAGDFERSGKGTQEDFYRLIENMIPAGRLGIPEELANSVVFLASEGAGYITGVALQVDGGFVQSLL